MSELGDLESAVVGLIAGLLDGGNPLFRSVEGFSDPDRKRAVAYVRGRATPAALVVYTGRLRVAVADSVVGLPKLTVLISAANLRGGDDPRVGDGSAKGGFELLASVMGVLDGTLVQTDRRLAAVDEQIAAGDETGIVYEQRYLVDREAELSAPTFDGVVLAGSGSVVRMIVGEASSEQTSFAFPGIDGVFRHHLGMRSRPIRWEGRLQAVDDTALNAIETQIEAAVANPGAFAMIDAWSRSYSDCVCDRFVRSGRRQRHPVSGMALQSFELHFTQLNR